jgi:hypothetical protein
MPKMPKHRRLIPEEIFRSRRNAQMRAEEEKLCKELDELFGEDDLLTEDNIEELGLPILATIPEIPAEGLPDLPSIDEMCKNVQKEVEALNHWIRQARIAAGIDEEDDDGKRA